jgi:hypothetical protein
MYSNSRDTDKYAHTYTNKYAHTYTNSNTYAD